MKMTPNLLIFLHCNSVSYNSGNNWTYQVLNRVQLTLSQVYGLFAFSWRVLCIICDPERSNSKWNERSSSTVENEFYYWKLRTITNMSKFLLSLNFEYLIVIIQDGYIFSDLTGNAEATTLDKQNDVPTGYRKYFI